MPRAQGTCHIETDASGECEYVVLDDPHALERLTALVLSSVWSPENDLGSNVRLTDADTFRAAHPNEKLSN
ncbi:MAG TPA: hypothetical protein VIJ25_18280 [Methylococcales bacterium]